MARTYRRSRMAEKFGDDSYTEKFKAPRKERYREGIEQHHSVHCNHRGSCSYCVDNRLHAQKRQEPAPE